MKIEGFWFSPNDIALKHFGILTISSSNSIELKLWSYYPKNVDAKIALSQNLRTLLGENVDGLRISLFGGILRKGTGSTIFERTLTFSHCIHGSHLYSLEECFSSYRVGFSKLLNLFHREYLHLMTSYKERSFNETLLYKSEDRTIVLKYNNLPKGGYKNTYSVVKECYLEVTNQKPISIVDILKEVESIQLFLSIISQEPQYCNSIRFRQFNKSGTLDNLCSLFYRKGNYNNSKDYKASRVFHRRESVIRNIQSALNIWFRYADILRDISHLILSSYFVPNLNVEIEFFNKITAVESWHRKMVKEEDSESKAFFQTVLSEFDSDSDIYRWIKNKKKLMTGISLPKRLKSLIGDDELSLIKNTKVFISKCVNTRNRIAHNLDESKKTASDIEKYLINQILKLLIEIEILKMFELTTEDISQLLENSNSMQQIRHFRIAYPNFEI